MVFAEAVLASGALSRLALVEGRILLRPVQGCLPSEDPVVGNPGCSLVFMGRAVKVGRKLGRILRVLSSQDGCHASEHTRISLTSALRLWGFKNGFETAPLTDHDSCRSLAISTNFCPSMQATRF